MVPDVLQIVGALLLVLFLFAVWPPLCLAGAGLFLLITGVIGEKNGSA